VNDLWVSATAGLAVAGLLVGQRLLRSSQEASKVIERLESGAAKKPFSRSRGPLLEGAASRVAGTFWGSRLAAYSSTAHPGELFSDVLAWGVAAMVAGALAGTLIFGRGLPTLLLALAAPVFADRLLIRVRGSRAARIEKQLPNALALQASALRAGQSLARSLRIVEEGTKSPLKDELERMLNHIDLGMPVDEALEQFAARTSSRDLDLWVDAMLVHRQTGGNLANVIESLSTRVSQRMNLRSEIRGLTAQGRLSGMVVAGAPIAFFLMLSIGSREQMEFLYTTAVGWVLLASGLTMNALGLLWIKAILRIRP
jgi:tight adherence protein B